MVIKGKMIIIIKRMTFTQLFLLLRCPWRCLWASATAALCVSLRYLDYQAGHNGWVSIGCSCILPYFCKISSLWQCCTHSGGWLQQNSRSHPGMIFPAWNYRPSASSWCLLVRRPGRFATHGQDWLGGGQGCLVSGAANVKKVVPQWVRFIAKLVDIIPIIWVYNGGIMRCL